MNGLKSGIGILKYTDGRKFEGKFLQDKQHGNGLLYDTDDRIIKGIWENGVLIDPPQFDTFSNS